MREQTRSLSQAGNPFYRIEEFEKEQAMDTSSAYRALLLFFIKQSLEIKETEEHLVSVMFRFNSKELKTGIVIRHIEQTLDEAVNKVLDDLLRIAPHLDQILA